MPFIVCAIGVIVGLATSALNLWLSARESEAEGSPLWHERWWAPALDGAFFGLAALKFGFTPALFATVTIGAVLVQIFVFDFRHRLILNVVTYPGTLLALAVSPWNPLIHETAQIRLASSLLGAVLGGGLFFILVAISAGSLGLGDAKFAAFLGAAIGMLPLPLPPVLRALAYGMFFGGLIAFGLLVTRIKGPKDYVPYGPFLVFGAMLALLTPTA